MKGHSAASQRTQIRKETITAGTGAGPMGTSPITWGMEGLGSSPGELPLGLSPEGQVVVN